MNDSPAPAPASAPALPNYDELAADPAIAPLLGFEPVFRRVKRPDGWTPELQREFIALLAWTGSPRKAAEAMGKKVSGVEALYREADADTFRASWDQALAIGRARTARPAGARFTGRPPSSGGGWIGPEAEEEEEEVSEERHIELMDRIGNKFLRKVVAERSARMNGEIAAADFYLRQITVLEVMFELTSEAMGFDVWAVLKQLQRGGHSLAQIAETPFSRKLDAYRREFWIKTGEPMRPMTVRGEYLIDHGDHSTEPGNAALGKCTAPPPGVDGEAWAAMGYDEQSRVRGEVYRQAAEDQVAWEAAARREYEERRESDRLT